jgi:hypothetical protein
LPITSFAVAIGAAAPCLAQVVPGSTGFQNTNPFGVNGPVLNSGPNPQTNLTILYGNPLASPGTNLVTPPGFSVHQTPIGNFLFANAGNGALANLQTASLLSNIGFNNPSLVTQTARFLPPTFINGDFPTDKVERKHKRKKHKSIFGKDDEKKPGPYQPVAVAPSLPSIPLIANNSDAYSLRHDGQAKITTATANSFTVENGSILVVAHKPIEITCNGMRVTLDTNAMVHLSVSKDCVTVRTLHDDHMNDVKVAVGTEKISVAVGTELCIGNDEATVSAELSRDTMNRRGSIGSKLANGKFAKTSTFPLHMMLLHPMLISMYRHGEQDRSHVQKVMKTAACLHIAGRNGSM